MPKKITVQANIRRARRTWENLPREALIRLKEIATEHHFSVGAGDLIYLNNGWYVDSHRLVRVGAPQSMRRHSCSARLHFL